MTTASAANLIVIHRLSAALANAAVLAAVTSCAKQGYGVTAILVDTDGVVQASLRGDAASVMTLEAANAKAYTSVSMGVDTIVLVEQFKHGRLPVILEKAPHFVLAQGGVVIKAGDEVIAALGVAGAPSGDKDEACARAALDQIADRLK